MPTFFQAPDKNTTTAQPIKKRSYFASCLIFNSLTFLSVIL